MKEIIIKFPNNINYYEEFDSDYDIKFIKNYIFKKYLTKSNIDLPNELSNKLLIINIGKILDDTTTISNFDNNTIYVINKISNESITDLINQEQIESQKINDLLNSGTFLNLIKKKYFYEFINKIIENPYLIDFYKSFNKNDNLFELYKEQINILNELNFDKKNFIPLLIKYEGNIDNVINELLN